ncbi:MAG: ABC transporter permease [Defluviitaleaceae bacterium]|nr:ABC transporter permease [Defluviitaleaceae bacterium]
MSLNMFLGALSQGLLWGVMAMGVWITYRVLNYADLTAEGSFTLGAAVAARLITAGIFDPLTSTLIAMAAGILAGLVTGFLHTVLGVPPLLSGILSMTGLYSINLRVMGMANIPLLRGTDTLMTQVGSFFGVTDRNLMSIIVGLICVSIVILLLKLFFNTEIGYVLRATGDNEAMVKAQGVSTKKMKLLGLMLGNACVALSGALVFQFQGFADIGMGVGTIVIGLASVIIGEVIFRDKNSHRALIAVVLGSILYRIIIAFVLGRGIHPNDFRLISAMMLALALSMPLIREKLNLKRFLPGTGWRWTNDA